MATKLAMKKALCQISEKVKCVNIHPENPWVLSARFDGVLQITNYESQVSLADPDHRQVLRSLEGHRPLRRLRAEAKLDRSRLR